MRHLFLCWKHWSVRLQLAARGKNVLFWPKKLYIWDQKSIFCIVIAIFVNGAYNNYTRGYNFPIRTIPKFFQFPSYGSPRFLTILGHTHLASKSTLNFGPSSTKPGGTIRVIKKNDPQYQKTWSWPELRFHIWLKSVFLAESLFFSPKTTQNLLKDWYLFGKRVVLFAQLFPVVASFLWLHFNS